MQRSNHVVESCFTLLGTGGGRGGGLRKALISAGDNMNFLIAYDICHPRRLRRIARRMERVAIRLQKSVFLYEGDEAGVQRVLESSLPTRLLVSSTQDRFPARSGASLSAAWNTVCNYSSSQTSGTRELMYACSQS